MIIIVFNTSETLDEETGINTQIDTKGEIELISSFQPRLVSLSICTECIAPGKGMMEADMSGCCLQPAVVLAIFDTKAGIEMVPIKTDKVARCNIV